MQETKYIVTVNDEGTFWRNEAGKRHRLGGLPAIEFVNGDKYYYENDQYHRLGGLPACEYANGNKSYYENGKLLTEAEAKRQTISDPCDGKLVTIEGKQYKLTAV